MYSDLATCLTTKYNPSRAYDHHPSYGSAFGTLPGMHRAVVFSFCVDGGLSYGERRMQPNIASVANI